MVQMFSLDGIELGIQFNNYILLGILFSILLVLYVRKVFLGTKYKYRKLPKYINYETYYVLLVPNYGTRTLVHPKTRKRIPIKTWESYVLALGTIKNTKGMWLLLRDRKNKLDYLAGTTEPLICEAIGPEVSRAIFYNMEHQFVASNWFSE